MTLGPDLLSTECSVAFVLNVPELKKGKVWTVSWEAAWAAPMNSDFHDSPWSSPLNSSTYPLDTHLLVITPLEELQEWKRTHHSACQQPLPECIPKYSVSHGCAVSHSRGIFINKPSSLCTEYLHVTGITARPHRSLHYQSLMYTTAVQTWQAVHRVPSSGALDVELTVSHAKHTWLFTTMADQKLTPPA
jgi:hypothetical protein